MSHSGKEFGVSRKDVAILIIMESAFISADLHAMTDQQIADLVQKELWMTAPIMSRQSLLLSQVIDRLERTGNGKLEVDDDPE